MNKTIKIIKIIKKLNNWDLSNIFNYLKNKKNTNVLYFQEITEKKSRSLKSLKRYWVSWLPIVCNYLKGFDQFVIDTKNGFNYQPAHRFLMLQWAREKQYIDLIKLIPIQHENKIIKVAEVSLAFENLSQKKAQDYYNWLHSMFFKHIGKEIEEVEQEIS